MFNSQRNSNSNIRYISYPRQTVTELPHHPNHRHSTANNNTYNILHRSEPTTSLRQNPLSPTNQFKRLVRRLVNRSSSGSNNSSGSRSLQTRTQTIRTQATGTPARSSILISTSTAFTSPSSTSIASSIVPNSTNASSTESDPFPFNNPWSVPPNSSSSNHVINSTEQEYSLRSAQTRNPIQRSNTSRYSLYPLRSTRPATPTPPPRPLSPTSSDSFDSNINAIREYFNMIPLIHDSTNLARTSRRRLSNSSYHSIDQQSNNNNTSNQPISSNDIIENNFHDPFNHSQYIIQNHSSREAFCFSSKLPSNLNDDDDESDDYSSSYSERSNNNYECEQEEKQGQQKVEECYLCLESLDLRGGRMIINPGCGHSLHMKCYLEYIKYFREQCTLCKKDFGNWND